jgi:hypothetical protein
MRDENPPRFPGSGPAADDRTIVELVKFWHFDRGFTHVVTGDEKAKIYLAQ